MIVSNNHLYNKIIPQERTVVKRRKVILHVSLHQAIGADLSCSPPMMNVPNQDRQWFVMLSAAKHLTRRPPRCFAALSMTTLDRALSMTSLDRFWSFTFIIGPTLYLIDGGNWPMMNFHKQDRQEGVMLSAAKHLSTRPASQMLRCAQHDKPFPVLVVELHHRR